MIRLSLRRATVLFTLTAGAPVGIARAADAPAPATRPAQTRPIRPGYVVGRIDHPPIRESSGIVASRRHRGVFWTVNDSGNPPALYAITATGEFVGEFPVVAENLDWEDVAIDGDGHLFIGEVGNNGGRKKQLSVYRVDEPDPRAKPNTAVRGPLRVNATWRLTFPGAPFDCESLFIYDGRGYVISKVMPGLQAGLYAFDLAPAQKPAKPAVLKHVCDLPVRSPVTAADLSADGKRLAVMTVTGPYLFTVNGDPAAAAKAQPAHVTTLNFDAEAICFARDGDLLATTERRHVLRFSDEDFGGRDDSARPEAVHVSVPRATKAPTVDGDLADWTTDDAGSTLRSDPATPDGAASAQLWSRWDDGGLYLAGVIPDPRVSGLKGEWYTGDVVEIFVGPESADRGAEYGPGDERCYVGFAAGPDGALTSSDLRWPRRKDGDAPPGAAAVARVNDDGTYQFEAFIPSAVWSGDAGKAGGATGTGATAEQIRLNVSVLSHDPRRNWFLSASNQSGTWMSPLTWAVATLTRD